MAEENNWLLTKDWSKYTLFEPVFSMPNFTSESIQYLRFFLVDCYLYLQYAINKEKTEILNAFHKLKFATLAKKLALNIPKLFSRLPSIIQNKMRQKKEK